MKGFKGMMGFGGMDSEELHLLVNCWRNDWWGDYSYWKATVKGVPFQFYGMKQSGKFCFTC